MFPVTVARPVLLSQRESFLQESAVGYWDNFCHLQVTASLSPPMCFANASPGASALCLMPSLCGGSQGQGTGRGTHRESVPKD